jgi:uncharacterized tellurite resistance protein B-like protein
MTPELHTHFLNLYSMALADSSFDEKEISILYRIGEERGIPKEKIDAMLLSPPLTEHLHLPDTLGEKIGYLYDYAKMILADGVVHDDEINTLEKFCIKFQFEEKNVPAIAQLLIEAAKNNISKNDLLDFVTQNN